jgi:hypothetical protein
VRVSYCLTVAGNRQSGYAGRNWDRIKSWGVIDTFVGFTGPTRIIFLAMFLSGVMLCASLSPTDVGIGLTQRNGQDPHPEVR